jgi:hypothetical protein
MDRDRATLWKEASDGEERPTRSGGQGAGLLLELGKDAGLENDIIRMIS